MTVWDEIEVAPPTGPSRHRVAGMTYFGNDLIENLDRQFDDARHG